MGKKNKNKSKKSTLPHFTPAVYTSSKLIASELLNLCLHETPTAGKLLPYFEKLYDLTSKLIALQKSFHFTNSLCVPQSERQNRLNSLLEMLSDRGLPIQNCSVSFFENEGFGLKANSKFEKDNFVLEVPMTEFLSTQEAAKDIGTFLSSNTMTAQMPNVSLALYLLSELAAGSQSKWFHYINSLPEVYETALYIQPEDLPFLKGSPSLELVVNTYRNICRQYASIFRLMDHNTFSSCLHFKDAFCFEDYRWACSTIMSRNNPVPVSQGSLEMRGDLALIPVWDLINHKQGQGTTNFDSQTGSIKFYAMEDYDNDAQIFMHYGNRSNAEFFTFAGFVDTDCAHDKVSVKLGISQNDPVFKSKEFLLNLMGLESHSIFHISKTCPLPPQMVAFARVFSMKEKNLLEVAAEESDKVAELFSKNCSILSDEVDIAAINFLRIRLQLLISAYPEQKEGVSSELTATQLRCVKLCDSEKLLLKMALKEIESYKEL